MKRRTLFGMSIKFMLTVSLSMALEFSCTRIVQNEITESAAWFKPHYVTVVDTVLALPDTMFAIGDTTTVTIVDTMVVVSTLVALPETVHVFSDTLTVVKVVTEWAPPVFVTSPPETVIMHDTVTVPAPLYLPPRPWESPGRPDGAKTP